MPQPTSMRLRLLSSLHAWRARWLGQDGAGAQTPSCQSCAPAPAPVAVSGQQRMEVIGRLAGRFSHEFNNQLGIISNSAYLIGRRAQDPRLALPAQAMLRSVEAASALTLRLQRLANRQPAGAQPLDLGLWLQQLEPAFAMVLGKRMVLDLRTAPQQLCVHVAHDELDLALTSVLLCVREMLPDGARVSIDVRRVEGAQRQLPPGAYAQLGIDASAHWAGPPQEQEQEQEHAHGSGPGQAGPGAESLWQEPVWAPDDACEDWGLGLARSLARASGGGLWAAAEQGRSLCVRLVLPELAHAPSA